MADNNILFVRGKDNASDAWDDRMLIKAYDKAVSLAKEEVAIRLGLESQNIDGKQEKQDNQEKPASQKQGRQKNKSTKKWCVGSPCKAIYSEDGKFYEATITKVFENTGKCIVQFIGYNNTEKVDMSSLIESDGMQSQIQQKSDAAAFQEQGAHKMEFEESPKLNGHLENPMDCDTNQAKSFKNSYTPNSFPLDAVPPAPPLPPQLMAKLPENDADALSSMLMSWYISGFHTGYYHGLKQARSSQVQNKK